MAEEFLTSSEEGSPFHRVRIVILTPVPEADPTHTRLKEIAKRAEAEAYAERARSRRT
jgi:hypothetical protein